MNFGPSLQCALSNFGGSIERWNSQVVLQILGRFDDERARMCLQASVLHRTQAFGFFPGNQKLSYILKRLSVVDKVVRNASMIHS